MASAVWLYLLCVASFGIYALVWVYRAARSHGSQDRFGATAWALGSIAAPICCAVLYVLGRATGARLERAGFRPASPAWLAPALYGAIAAASLVSPLRTLWTPFWLLAPVPIVLVDVRLRAAIRANAGRAAPAPKAGLRRRLLEGSVVLFGLPLVVLAAVELDSHSIQILRSAEDDGPMVGASGAYALHIPSEAAGLAWHRTKPGTLAQDQSDLELSSDDRQSWVIVFAHESGLDIDTVVDARRELIFEESTDPHFIENRFFLEGADLLPTSLADYAIGSNAFTQARYIVLTVLLEGRVFEVVGYTTDPAAQSDQLHAIVTSFTPRRAETAGPEES